MPTSLNASLNVKLNAASLNASSKQVKQALGRITGQASEFQKSLDASTARVFAFGATTAVLNGVTQSFKKLVATTVEVQKRLVEINSIFKATESAFNRFRNAIFQVAKETGQSFGTVAEGAAELARQGLSAAETAERLKAALVLTRISGMDAEKSVKALTAAINGFTSAGLTANQIVNKMVAVDTAFAVSTQDLAEAFSRAGSTAEDAGVSFNELLGLVTAVEQRTARGGAVIGNAFKSIFTRLARGSTIESLKELGVQIDATQSGIQKLKALSNALENISDPTIASEIKELAGGVFQINVVSAALKDLANDTSIFKNAAMTAATATNEAFEKNVGLNKTISAQMNSLVQGLTSLAERVGTVTFGPLLENLVGVAEKFTTFLDKALDPEKGNVFIKGFFKAIGAFLGGPMIILFTAAFAKIVKLVAKFAVGGLKSLFAMGTQIEKIKQIEGGIVGLLGRDSALRKTITSTTATQAQKEQAIITAIKTENALLQQQAALVRGLASAAAARGVRGFGASGFTGRRGMAFASGYQDEEAMATLLGAKNPKARRTTAQIRGRKQNILYNNQEDIYRGVGRNGDDAIIPRYAGGFVPNYAVTGRVNLESIIRNKRGLKSPEEVSQAKRDLKAMDARKAAKENQARINISGAGKAMFVPRKNDADWVKPHKGVFYKGKTKIPYNLTGGFGIRGPNIPQGADAAGDPQDERLKENVLKDIIKNAKNYANTLIPVTKRDAATDSEIKKSLEEQGGGIGAINAAVGVAFEAAILTGLKLSPAKKKKGGDFDVRPVTDDVKRLFYGPTMEGAKSLKLADFKSSASDDAKLSFIRKIANEKYHNDTAEMLTALGKTKGKAAGFIPNFANRGGLGAAVEREKAAGVPVSQIRAHFDKGGRPKAVTNTKDEPNGLASLGFIPNFAKGEGGGMGMGGLMMGLFALQGVLGTFAAKQEQNVNAIESEIDARNKEVKIIDKDGKVRIGAFNKELDANKKELAQRSENTSSMHKFMEATNTAAKALMALTTINMLTGGMGGRGLGKLAGFGKKGKAAWGAAAKASAAVPAIGGATRMVATKGTAGVASGVGYSARARVGAPIQFTRQQSMAQRAGRFTAGMGAKAKAYGLRQKFGGVAGKAAGRLGALGAVGMGGIEAWKTSQDDSLYKSQKKERYTKTGVKTGFTAAGAALGTLIPIPVLGTLVGGAIGAWIGSAVTGGESKADTKREKSQIAAEKYVQESGVSTLGLGRDKFTELATKNLEKIHKSGGDAGAVMKRYRDAMEARTAIVAKIKNGEEVNNEESVAAHKELVAATMLLAGSHLRSGEAFLQNTEDIKKANEAVLEAQKGLAALKKKEMAGVVDTIKEAKKKEKKAELQVGLASSIKGPYAGAVGLASEQNLMLKKMGTAQAEKSKADRELAIAEGEGAPEEDLEGLREAAEKAGQAFIDQANKAGISFKNHIKKTEGLLEQNRKKQGELEKKQYKTSESAIREVLSGKKTGNLAPFLNVLEGFKKELVKIDRERRRRATLAGKEGETDAYSKNELIYMSKMSKLMDEAYKISGAPMTSEDFLAQEGVGPDILKVLQDTQSDRRMATIGGLGDDPLLIAAMKTMLSKGGETAGEEMSDLKKAEKDLVAQMGVSATSWKALADATKKEKVTEKLNALQSSMEAAAGSFRGVANYVTTMRKSTADTSKMISLNDKFLKDTKTLIEAQIAVIATMKGRLDGLTPPNP